MESQRAPGSPCSPQLHCWTRPLHPSEQEGERSSDSLETEMSHPRKLEESPCREGITGLGCGRKGQGSVMEAGGCGGQAVGRGLQACIQSWADATSEGTDREWSPTLPRGTRFGFSCSVVWSPSTRRKVCLNLLPWGFLRVFSCSSAGKEWTAPSLGRYVHVSPPRAAGAGHKPGVRHRRSRGPILRIPGPAGRWDYFAGCLS